VSTIYIRNDVILTEVIGRKIYKHAEFAGPKKVGEGMALKIWAELRHPFRFICVFSSRYSLV
jgi:hypothetical protein